MKPEFTPNASRIAALNDAMRARIPFCAGDPELPGLFVVTRSIAALSQAAVLAILDEIRHFSAFERGDDPYGEHDFGALEHPEAGRIFWKFDYFADASCTSGSPDPSDPTQSFRVLTVMLAEDW
jgi:hypothetical protein